MDNDNISLRKESFGLSKYYELLNKLLKLIWLDLKTTQKVKMSNKFRDVN